jgi:hypothetical protein
MWPGLTRSSGDASRDTASWMVRARSAALMPVEIPSRASMETVKFVPNLDRLSLTMSGRFSIMVRRAVRARQMSPRP